MPIYIYIGTLVLLGLTLSYLCRRGLRKREREDRSEVFVKGMLLACHVIAKKKKRIPLFNVDSSTLPFFVEEG